MIVGFKILRLIIQILLISIYVGQYWFIFSATVHEYKFNESIDDPESFAKQTIEDNENHPTFVNHMTHDGVAWSLFDISGPGRAIITTYYAMTSLSTVGFGDYYPLSDEERVVCSFVLLFGVMLFSIFMGQLLDMIENFQNLDNEFN